MISDLDISQIMRDMIRVIWNEKDVDQLGEFVHDDYTATSSNGRFLNGIADLREDILETQQDMQNMVLVVEDLVINYDGDKHFEVAMFLSGSFMRDDQARSLTAADLFILDMDGKVVERKHIVIQEAVVI